MPYKVYETSDVGIRSKIMVVKRDTIQRPSRVDEQLMRRGKKGEEESYRRRREEELKSPLTRAADEQGSRGSIRGAVAARKQGGNALARARKNPFYATKLAFQAARDIVKTVDAADMLLLGFAVLKDFIDATSFDAGSLVDWPLDIAFGFLILFIKIAKFLEPRSSLKRALFNVVGAPVASLLEILPGSGIVPWWSIYNTLSVYIGMTGKVKKKG